MPWVIAEHIASKSPRDMRCCTSPNRRRRVGEGEVSSKCPSHWLHADRNVDRLDLGDTLAQKGSNSGRVKERKPLRLGTGAGRIKMTLAPRSVTQSSSRIASLTIGSAGSGHNVEGRVRDVFRDCVVNDELPSAVDLHQLDHMLVVVRQVTGEASGCSYM